MNRFNKIIHLPYKLTKCWGGKLLCISILLSRLIRWYYHCEIPYSINLQGVYFNHKGFGIVINPYAKIGKGTSIQHAVTIGELKGGSPVIGENCYIGARAIILGPIKIGNNVKIGAGSLVMTDIPDNCTAVGSPARIIRHDA